MDHDSDSSGHTKYQSLARGLEELKAAGVEHLMLTPARKVYHESVEAFAGRVLPRFR
jgi:hypothetical protein